jgi:hypothetical protein
MLHEIHPIEKNTNSRPKSKSLSESTDGGTDAP